MDHLEFTNFYQDYLVKFKQILLFDPTFWPHHLKKPEESDQQDAKLIYYFPENENIHEKRNHVGMAEGSFSFWKALNQDYQTDIDEENMTEVNPRVENNQNQGVTQQQEQIKQEVQFQLDKHEGIEKVQIQNNQKLINDNQQQQQQQVQNDVNSILDDHQVINSENTNNQQIHDNNYDNNGDNNQENLIDFSPPKLDITQSDKKDIQNINEQEDLEQKQKLERLQKIDEFIVPEEQKQNVEKNNNEINLLDDDNIPQNQQQDTGISNILESKFDGNQKNDMLFSQQQKDDMQKSQQKEEEKQEQQEEKQEIWKEEDQKCIITYLDRFIHIGIEIEKNYWLYIVFHKFNPEMQNIKTCKEEYYDDDQGVQELQCINRQSIKNIATHFYKTFQLFFGNFRKFLENPESKENFNTLFGEYIRRYQIINAHDHQHLNTQNYLYKGFKYAPIDRGNFLTIQYLISIIKTIDPKIKHFIVFYKGHFIFSSFKHSEALKLYDYYYCTGSPLVQEPNKVHQKFALLTNLKEKDINNYGYFYNGLNLGSKSQYKEGESIPDIDVTLQKIYIDLENNFRSGQEYDVTTDKQWQMNTFLERGFFMSMFYDETEIIKFKTLIEVNQALLKNCEKISDKIERLIDNANNTEENYKFFYYNNINFASKLSNSLVLQELLKDQMVTIRQIFEDLQYDDEAEQQVIKLSSAWVYGIKSVGRILIMLFPPQLQLQKVAEESEKLMGQYLTNLFF